MAFGDSVTVTVRHSETQFPTVTRRPAPRRRGRRPFRMESGYRGPVPPPGPALGRPSQEDSAAKPKRRHSEQQP
eukprot:662761-Hanusia_phi.AAC.1